MVLYLGEFDAEIYLIFECFLNLWPYMASANGPAAAAVWQAIATT